MSGHRNFKELQAKLEATSGYAELAEQVSAELDAEDCRSSVVVCSLEPVDYSSEPFMHCLFRHSEHVADLRP